MKCINLNNFKQSSPILGDFGIIFCFFKDIFILNIFEKCNVHKSLRFCLTSKHLETKLNYQKHIILDKFHNKKFQEEKNTIFLEFSTVIDTFGPYNQAPNLIL